MEWTADVAQGDWIRERLDPELSTSMHCVVPRGFAAYARVFHPATRDRPVGMPWPPLPYGAHRREWEAFQDSRPDIDGETVTWREAAAGFGTVMHPLAQWNALVGRFREVEGEDGPRDGAGWRYAAPSEGHPPAPLVAALAGILAGHTSTPDDGVVALWEGWGGLLGFMGDGPSRVFFQFSDDPQDSADLDRHNRMLGEAATDRFNNVFMKPTWQPGILSDDISRGPRLELPARGHVLFRGGVAELAAPDWELSVPWRDREVEEHGFPATAQSPSIVWPADRAWTVVSEVDFDSTIVAGSPELIAAVVASPSLEAHAIPADADLTWDGDMVNR